MSIASMELDWKHRDSFCIEVAMLDEWSIKLGGSSTSLSIFDHGKKFSIKLNIGIFKEGAIGSVGSGMINYTMPKFSKQYRYFFKWQDKWWLLHCQSGIRFSYGSVTQLDFSFWQGYVIKKSEWEELEIGNNIQTVIG